MIRAFEQRAPEIDARVYVDDTALVVGEVRIGKDSSIWPMCVLRGDVNYIRVGERSNLQDGTIVHVNHSGPFNPEGDPVNIGDDVTVGHRALIHACDIGDRCLIGMAAVIMDDVLIESDVMVAGGSLVVPGSHLKSGYLWKGAPARPARELTDTELEKIRYSAKYYAELAQRHSAA